MSPAGNHTSLLAKCDCLQEGFHHLLFNFFLQYVFILCQSYCTTAGGEWIISWWIIGIWTWAVARFVCLGGGTQQNNINLSYYAATVWAWTKGKKNHSYYSQCSVNDIILFTVSSPYLFVSFCAYRLNHEERSSIVPKRIYVTQNCKSTTKI